MNYTNTETPRETTITDPKIDDLFSMRTNDWQKPVTWRIRHVQHVSEITEYPNVKRHYESCGIVTVLEISKPNGKEMYAVNIHEDGRVFSFEIVRLPERRS